MHATPRDRAGRDDGDELALWQTLRAGGDPAARVALVERYLGLAQKIAGRLFKARGGADIEFEEYRQLAYMGLMESVDRFDPARGASFSTYASYRIEGAVHNGLEKLTEKRQQSAWRRRVAKDRAQSMLEPSEGDPARPSFEALADIAIGIALGTLLQGSGIVAQERPGEEDSPYSGRVLGELGEDVRRAVDALPERERMVIRHHYFQHVSFDLIARTLGLSKGRISQIHRRALMLLREEVAREDGIDGLY
jgi:RNA polymerase sigma factor for flagellar operon FliA